jgi:tRNA (cytidine/uridine-2'-O-)-methyltransferase
MNVSSHPAPNNAAIFSRLERHVVLVSPEIHWNTGNIGRTCLGTGARLHLIRPLGFSLENRYLKRAGLDYWQQVDVTVWKDFISFKAQLNPRPEEIFLLTKNGTQSFWQAPALKKMFLIFGSETKGLPASILTEYPQAIYSIPMTGQIRSLNLSTAVGIVLYDSYRSLWLNSFTTTETSV